MPHLSARSQAREDQLRWARRKMNGGPNGKCRQIVAPVQKFCHTPRDHGQRLDETLDETAPEGKVVLISRSEPTVSSIKNGKLGRSDDG